MERKLLRRAPTLKNIHLETLEEIHLSKTLKELRLLIDQLPPLWEEMEP
uniref:Protein C2 n=1 Tax=Oak-Vale virus TaxID=318852 RepID=D8V091_9RHAB|nr:protein C2 [Oak-Vale virus]